MSRKVTNGLDLRGSKIEGVGAGSLSTDAATYGQVQAAIRGLDAKEEVRAATTGNITLNGLQSVDGVSLVAGDRVLVKNQTDATTNGIYVAASGAWARSVDADENAEVTRGLSVAVMEGTNKGTSTAQPNPVQWSLSTPNPITLGTTSLTFAVVGAATGSTYTAGTGLILTGGAFSIDPTYTGLAKRFSQSVGDGSSATITVTHNLGTRDVNVTLFDSASYEEVLADVTHATINTVVLTFGTAPATGSYRVVVVG